MTAPGNRPVPLAAIVITAGAICFLPTMASDDLRWSSRVNRVTEIQTTIVADRWSDGLTYERTDVAPVPRTA